MGALNQLGRSSSDLLSPGDFYNGRGRQTCSLEVALDRESLVPWLFFAKPGRRAGRVILDRNRRRLCAWSLGRDSGARTDGSGRQCRRLGNRIASLAPGMPWRRSRVHRYLAERRMLAVVPRNTCHRDDEYSTSRQRFRLFRSLIGRSRACGKRESIAGMSRISRSGVMVQPGLN
jgi:hypothetical protein